MCGVIGNATLNSTVYHNHLDAAVRQLNHRGPDGSGCWHSLDGLVSLGHCRLAILDLSAMGNQPMAAASGYVCITFNGEIYNFNELRQELTSKGYQFRGRSDTEVILKSYLAWGVECVNRLDGMFAFAIYDGRTGEASHGKLFLARDRAGEKPLYYWRHPGGFSFASELKAIMTDPAFPRRLNLDALNQFLAFGYVSGENCILSGVKKLAPAHAMTYDLTRGDYRIWRYWIPPAPAVETVDESQLLMDLESCLEASVRRQLVADVPVGILLSGGLDSSLVTAMAARCSSHPVKTFTVSFPGQGHYDEGPRARIIADYFATDHRELVAEPVSLDILTTLARQFDEPLADSSLIPTYLVSKLTREHVKVALGGDGGDELFGGYGHYSAFFRDERIRRGVPRIIRDGLGAIVGKLPQGVKGRNYLLSLRGDSVDAAARGLYFDLSDRIRLLAPDRVHDLGVNISVPETSRSALWNRNWGLVDNLTRLDFQAYLPDDILVKTDRASMAVSLELRAPWLDRTMIEFSFGRVPACLKANHADKKILPRRLAQKLLPAGMDFSKKQGFSIPINRWFRGDFGKLITDILLAEPDDIFRRDAVCGLLRGQRAGFSNASRLFALAMFLLWRREYSVAL